MTTERSSENGKNRLEETFSRAYMEDGPGILKYLLSSGMQLPDAQDTLQNSFLVLWNLRFRIEDTEHLAPLWITIARHKMFDCFRRNRRTVPLTSEPDSISAPEKPCGEMDLSYLRRRITEALRLLPEEMAEAYRLTKISGRPVREVAEMLDLSESDVKTKVFRARKKLMTALADLKDFSKI